MLEFKPIKSKVTWENFLLNSDQANFAQSWSWGEAYLKLGNPVERWGIYRQNRLVGVVQLLLIKAKRATYFECPGGPVLTWNQATVKSFNQWLRVLARKRGASFIRMRPNIADTPENRKLVENNLWRRSPMHLHAESTWILPLDLPEEELLKNMRKTTRYLINKAIKSRVKIIQSTSLADIDRLFKLQQATVDRKHFVPFAKKYFLAEMNSFLPDKVKLFKAEYNGQVLAMAMIIIYGLEAVYHYSGSSNEFREIPASYLLQWEVIKAAKKLGLQRYNFWGFTANPKHRFYGPSLFKKGFGGHELNYLPAHDLVVSLAYWPNYWLETMRRIWRRL